MYVQASLSERLKQARHYADVRDRLNRVIPIRQVEAPQIVPVSDPMDLIFGPKVYPPSKMPTLTQIMTAVCEFYGTRKIDFLSERRTADLVRPRQVFCYLAYVLTRASYPQMGRLINRDHTTCLFAQRKLGARMANEPRLEEEVAAIRRSLVGDSFEAPGSRVTRSKP